MLSRAAAARATEYSSAFRPDGPHGPSDMLPSRLPRLPQSTVHSSASRLIAIACATAALLAGGGLGVEAWRFGLSRAAMASRLERDVRDRFAARSRDVQSLGARVARATAGAVARAGEQPDDLPALFDQLSALASGGTGGITATTVTVYGRPSGRQYKILAWSDGPAENVQPDRLAGEASVFVAPGTLGLVLISVQPILFDGRRIAVAAAETVLAPAMGVDQPPGTYRLETSFGPVAVRYPGGIETALHAGAFAIVPPGGGGFDVQVSAEQLRDLRSTFRRRTLALAALPLIAALLLLTGPLLRRRSRARTAADLLLWSTAAALMVAGAAAALVWLSWLVAAPDSCALAIEGLAALALVALLPASWWWRRPRRLRGARAPLRFVLEHVAAGAAVAGCLWLMARLLDARITPASLFQWQLPLFRLPPDGLLHVLGLLLAELALFWGAAMLLAVLADRWRVGARRPGRTVAAAALWLAPAVVLVGLAGPRPAQLLAGGAVVMFGVGASAVRRRYRQTTQAMRLVVLFLALLLPLAALYPLAWFYADSTAREIVSRDYAPATARRPNDTLDVLTRVRAEIDRIPLARLLPLVAPTSAQGAPVPTLPAFERLERDEPGQHTR